MNKTVRMALVLFGIVLLALTLASCGQAPIPSDCSHYENTVAALLTQVSVQSTQIAVQEEQIASLSIQDQSQSAVESPEPQPTPIVQGSVVIEDGGCCTVGIIGQTISIQAAFEAVSTAAEVNEMRVRSANLEFDESGLEEANWEPIAAQKTFEYTAPVNWTGFYVSVQFRDAEGNLSPVYWDDVSVEGMTPTMTPTP